MPSDFYPDQLKKFCVFCGKTPDKKNDEHIIPQWLIRKTGEPNRVLPLAFDKKTFETKSQSALSFVFPACTACNTEFSDLEGRVSLILDKLLNDEAVGQNELSSLMDWLDKVRVGLWLGDMMRNKDFVFVERHFHIKDRIGQKDRISYFFKAGDSQKGFTIAGVHTPTFHFRPSCFGLTVNNLYIVNVSFDYLFMGRLGFPRYVDRYFTDDGLMGGRLIPGKEKIHLPIVDYDMPLDHFAIFQPCISNVAAKRFGYDDIFNTEFIQKNTIDGWKGKIFLKDGTQMFEGEEKKSLGLNNLKQYQRGFLHPKSASIVLDVQNWLQREHTPSMSRYTKRSRKFWEKIGRVSYKTNEALINKISNELQYFDEEGELNAKGILKALEQMMLKARPQSK